MELCDFIERYLPDKEQNEDYKELKRAEEAKTTLDLIKLAFEGYRLQNKLFHATLANYTALICQKQRALCANVYHVNIMRTPNGKIPDFAIIFEDIYSAPQPKPEKP